MVNRIRTGVIAAALIAAAARVTHANASSGHSGSPLLAIAMLALPAGSALRYQRARPLLGKDPL